MNHETGSIYPTLVWSVKEAMYKWYSLGEIDFQQHLQVQKITSKTSSMGHVDAFIQKNEPVRMQLPFVIWDNLVLTWVWM